MSDALDLLIEIGSEELPPTALEHLSRAFTSGIVNGLEKASLAHGEVESFATPRRLAVLVRKLVTVQPERQSERRGPALKAAFDADGKPTKAALGFARSCGVEVEHLERLETDQGAWLVYRSTQVAQFTASLVPEIIEAALNGLPIPKRMRWGASDAEFVRPVRWVVVLFGESLVECQVLGVASGVQTHGHRFHCPQPLTVTRPGDYAALLEEEGHVIADFGRRRERVEREVRAAASGLTASVVIDPALLDEVTALTEWPVGILAGFEPDFLAVPAEALIATMKGNQKYFHMVDEHGDLQPHFVAVANLESRAPESIRRGNERVVRPRLADARFFFESDSRTALADRLPMLGKVVFQKELGTLEAKSQRVAELAFHVAVAMGEAPEAAKVARRAGLLCKCDLVTDMVGEFPELQGYMGGRYATASGEPQAVAEAIGEVYLPRFAGDALPASRAGMAVAMADRLDTLTGIFGIKQPPSGDRDPFALRRAALGVLRILIEGELDLDLTRLTEAAAAAHGEKFAATELGAEVFDFTVERLRAYFADQGIAPDVFAAVLARRPRSPFDFARRVHAVATFRSGPGAASLAAANKRIQNILRQAETDVPEQTSEDLFRAEAEWDLWAKLMTLAPRVRELLKRNDYTGALELLSGLREPVDAFFETVRVMDDDPQVRDNRLALLETIRALFLKTADISQLQH